jgi:membrane associated rhomboid family serine protease
MQESFRPRGFSILPVVVKNLLIINGLMFLFKILADARFGLDLDGILGLHYFAAQSFRPWQLITYMFMHGDIWHILFNMFALWMFGYSLENVWGPRRFLVFYMITGIGAALVQEFVFFLTLNPTLGIIDQIIRDPNLTVISQFIDTHSDYLRAFLQDNQPAYNKFQEALQGLSINPDNRQDIQTIVNVFTDFREYFLDQPTVIGASGAVYGILLAFGMLFPNTLIFIYFLFPIKAKYFVILYGLIELFSGISGSGSNIAHFAHLGGMIFGFFLILYWKKKGRLYS